MGNCKGDRNCNRSLLSTGVLLTIPDGTQLKIPQYDGTAAVTVFVTVADPHVYYGKGNCNGTVSVTITVTILG